MKEGHLGGVKRAHIKHVWFRVFSKKKTPNNYNNVVSILMCCTKSGLETECGKEAYLAILFGMQF